MRQLISKQSDTNKKEECSEKHSSFLLVGMTGLELATPTSRT